MPVDTRGSFEQIGVIKPGHVTAHSDPLYINIEGFRYEMEGTRGSYAGAVAQSVTDEQTNYVYLNDSGVLVINTTGFPSVGPTHIRLARVVTSNGEIQAIYDERAVLFGNGSGTLHTHANKAELDLITDGDHDVRTDNPHGVTAAQAGAAPSSHTHVEADITDLDHTDANAIHKNVAAEISTVAEKATPVAADLVLIEDSADANNKKRVQVGNLPGGTGGDFGADYQSAESLTESNTTSGDWQTKLQLVTPALTGKYRIGMSARIWQANVNDSVQARLYNVTDTAEVLGPYDEEPNNSTNRFPVAGFAEVTFTGSAKTFEIQYRQDRGSTAYIDQARLEIWKVGS
jgi:hypothetical protein